MSYPILLGAVVIGPSNKVLRVKIGAGAVESATIAEDTYYLRGDGAADDLCVAIKAALDATTGVNTYSVTPFFNLAADTIHTVVQIARTSGTDAFELRFADGLHTFDEALIGFLGQTYSGGTPYVSDEAAAAVWASNDHAREIEPMSEKVAAVNRTASGLPRGVSRSARMQSWRMALQYVSDNRMNVVDAVEAGYGEGNALEAFVDRFGAGARFELHVYEDADDDQDADAGEIDEDTLKAVCTFAETTLTRFEPQRLGPGVPLYSHDLVMHEVPS